MKSSSNKKLNAKPAQVITVIAGIAVNVILAFLTYRADLPLYNDTIGTIAVTMLGGVFPGVIVSVVTSVICGSFNPDSFYFTFIGVTMVLGTVSLFNRSRGRNRRDIFVLIPLLSLLSGVLGMIFQWVLLGHPQFSDVAQTAKLISESGFGFFLASMFVNIGINLIDKTIAVAAAYLVYRLIPDYICDGLWNSGWKQKPLTLEEMKSVRTIGTEGKGTLRGRLSIMLAVAALVLTLAMSWISMTIYFDNTKEEYTQNAERAAKFAASVIDPDKIDDYINHGKDVPGYMETRKLLYDIRDNARGVKYLYAVKIREDGCYYIFDLATDDTEPNAPGTFTPFEEAFEPYLPALFAGEDIKPIESDDISGWVLTVYCPVKNAAGKTVCYVGTDVSMDYLSGYMGGFLLKTLLIFSGFFALVLVYGMWISRYYLIYPIGTMTKSAMGFSVNTDDQKSIDAGVRRIKELDIRTGDEVEQLYNSISKMAVDMAEQIRSVRHYASATARMQSGLIMTMADMVENRDSDTGAHVQKTSAYVRILLESLRRKGYYAEKITSNYISDVEISAPLHDVGKINIPDAVLNKPGKLTDEEFAIMKTHTTAGKKIIEKAISTLEGENYLKEARNMAAYHHERWDGKGYPEGLHGEVIPLSARVMSIADVFDALVSPRVYKPAFPLEKALSIIQEGAGTQFDPKCVEAFMDALDEVIEVMKKYQEA